MIAYLTVKPILTTVRPEEKVLRYAYSAKCRRPVYVF